MKTKHTPGPWSVHILNQESERPGIEADGISIVIYGIRDKDDEGIHGHTLEQEMANARLIAAAPDLLDALTCCLDQSRNGPLPDKFREVGNAAIAKAKGETP